MSNKMMLGLLLSAAVGLGATAASAADPKYPGGGYPEYTKKAALIIIDKDYKTGKIEEFCKVPVKVKGDNLQSDDPQSVKYNNKPKKLTITCKFKDKVEHPNAKKFAGVHKDGFLCKAIFPKYTLTTYYSIVDVRFEHREPNKHEYMEMVRDGKKKDKVVEAHVKLQCVFEKKKDDHKGY